VHIAALVWGGVVFLALLEQGRSRLRHALGRIGDLIRDWE
jgi:hypothetical protein